MTSLTTTSRTASDDSRKKPVRLKVGLHIRVLAGVASPDFPDVSFAGWTARIMEMSGRKPPIKYFVEWDEPVIAAMPLSYVDRCEQQQIYHRWACLSEADFEVLEDNSRS